MYKHIFGKNICHPKFHDPFSHGVTEVLTAALNFQEARNMATVPPTMEDLAEIAMDW